MVKNSLFYMILILCCFISMGCKKKLTVDENKISMEINQDSIDSNNLSDSVEIEENNINVFQNSETSQTNNSSINTSELYIGSMDLDSNTENFIYGTWKIDKLLGFANSYNDASEYPTGQKVIDDEIIIEIDLFSSKGIKNYDVYQEIVKSPLYKINTICYNSDSFYRVFKIDLPDLNMDDEIKWLHVYRSSTDLGIPLSFFIINDERLILLLEAACFELKKVTN